MDNFKDKYFQTDPAWIIREETADSKRRKLYEALFTLSNGYLGLRGINEDMPVNTCPGTYIAGAFDQSECMCPEFVNFPNPVPLYLVVEGEKMELGQSEILSHERWIDLKNGALCRETVFKKGEKETSFKSVRFVCRQERNSALMISEVTPLNWTGELNVVAELDGTAHNAFANYFPDEWARHLWLVSVNDTYDPDTVMVVRTRDLDVKYCFATYLDIERPFNAVKRFKKLYGERVVEEVTVGVKAGQPLKITKYIAVEDTKHVPEAELARTTLNLLYRNKIMDVESLWNYHKQAWDEKWQNADLKVSTADHQTELNAKIRFNIYHLLMNGSETDDRHGVGIKGFTGEMYRGHYFWDTEMYMFPFFVYTNPRIARNLMMFRYRILDAARKNAASRGFKGALYCWEDDERGNEGINHEIIRETGELRIRETIDQYHKNLAVMYAVFNYYRATRDVEFMIYYGADMLVENMRFWESYLLWNERKGCYDSLRVMGPDEYHANINNNYYTNYLFKAIGRQTLEFLEECRTDYKNAYYKICKRLGISAGEIEKWDRLVAKICLPEPKEGILEQYEGYFELEDYTFSQRNEFGIPVIVELDDLKNPANPKYTPDLIAYHEELVRMSQKMRIIKQADTVLLFNILPFDFSAATIKNTLLFYEARTLHYSSLSPGVYALCAARSGEMELAKRYLELSLDMDLKDVKHESENALHTPTSGEVYTIITQGYGGVFPNGDVLEVNPHLPRDWESLQFSLLWRKTRLTFSFTQKQLIIQATGGQEVRIAVWGNRQTVRPGDRISFPIQIVKEKENETL